MNQDFNALQPQNGVPGGWSPGGQAPAPGSVDSVSIAELLLILRRRRLVMLQTFVIITVVAIVVTLMTKPVYQATARLLVDNPTMSYNAVDTANPLSGILALSQPQNVKTQVDLLQSPALQKQVFQTVGGAAGLNVKEVEDTNLIEATAEATDPKVAAAAANTLLKIYIDQDTNQSLQEMRSAEAFAQAKEKEAQKQTAAAATALEQYKNKNHIAELTAERNLQIQRVAQTTTDVETAQTNLKAYQAQMDTYRKQLAGQPATLTAQVKTTNPTIKAVENQIADLRVQREGLTQTGGFTNKAPRIKAIDAQLAMLQTRMDTLNRLNRLDKNETISPNGRRDEITKAMAGLQVEMASVQTVLANKQRELAQAKDKINHYADWDTALQRLTFAVNNAATAQKMFADKIADLTLREQAHHATARIDDYAQVPNSPVRPKRALNIILGALFGLFAGLCMALVQEFLDDRINTMEDANRVLGLPSLGHVPTLTADDARLLPQMKGMDPAAESYRLLRTSIQFASIDTPIRTLLVTSSNPGEGKTTTAANLAFAMALDGKKVILVDTDLRRPSLHKLLSLPTVPGITDVLLDRAQLQNALLPHKDMPNLSTLSSGSTPPNPSELLNSRRFRNLVDEMASMCDIVIFDSPPVTVASDAPILGSMMDGTIMVVEAGETRKAPARHSLALLQKGRANVLGIMYNKMRALDGGGYYYYKYQYQYATPSSVEKLDVGNGVHPLPAPKSDDK